MGSGPRVFDLPAGRFPDIISSSISGMAPEGQSSESWIVPFYFHLKPDVNILVITFVNGILALICVILGLMPWLQLEILTKVVI